MNRISDAQLSALKWLQEHGGDGVFAGRGNTFLASGEIAPVMRMTWNALQEAGAIAEYGNKRRRITDLGKSLLASPRGKKTNASSGRDWVEQE